MHSKWMMLDSDGHKLSCLGRKERGRKRPDVAEVLRGIGLRSSRLFMGNVIHFLLRRGSVRGKTKKRRRSNCEATLGDLFLATSSDSLMLDAPSSSSRGQEGSPYTMEFNLDVSVAFRVALDSASPATVHRRPSPWTESPIAARLNLRAQTDSGVNSTDRDLSNNCALPSLVRSNL